VAGARPLASVYAALTVVGAALPLSRFLPWLLYNGADWRLFFEELFASRVGAFFALDVIVAAAVLLLFVIVQGRRDRVTGLWLPILATCLIGVSCGLPLFLWQRERALARG
jgi:hypothetical protein